MKRVFPWCVPGCYALLRGVAGSMFAMHGSLKLFGVPGDGDALPAQSLPGAGGVIELVAGTLIALGFLTRIAAFLASGEMAVAYFLAHFPNSVLPIVNGGELAALYSFLFLFVAVRGAGSWSVDALLPVLLGKRAAGNGQPAGAPVAVAAGIDGCWTPAGSARLPAPLEDAAPAP